MRAFILMLFPGTIRVLWPLVELHEKTVKPIDGQLTAALMNFPIYADMTDIAPTKKQREVLLETSDRIISNFKSEVIWAYPEVTGQHWGIERAAITAHKGHDGFVYASGKKIAADIADKLVELGHLETTPSGGYVRPGIFRIPPILE
jgi:hypothetical protein